MIGSVVDIIRSTTLRGGKRGREEREDRCVEREEREERCVERVCGRGVLSGYF